ncbi:MAG: NADP-dependent oxidoreductase [Burkholderiaceae bacterium]
MTNGERNQGWVLARRPKGQVVPEDFRLESTELPAIGDGEVLVRNHYLSLDPYMRGRMDDAKSYAASQPLDKVMGGGTVGEVVQSRSSRLKVGDKVVGMGGWQSYSAGADRDFKPIDTTRVPIQAYLGVVGMPGVTAWHGLNEIIAPKAGETVVVSAASGAVGATVGQLAKLKGCRVVGVAGGAEKCRAVVEEFGFDACVDYKAGNLDKDLKAALPDGVDGYFENVGGAVLDAVLKRFNAFGRIAICGLIAGYAGESIPVHQFRSVLVNRLKLQGFIVSEHPASWPKALAELGELVGSGRMKYRETVSQGLDSAPEAFIGLLTGRNFGKQLVKLV